MNWTEEEISKLNDLGFYPHWGDETDYRREVSYGDVIYDTVFKSSPELYNGTIYNAEGDRWHYEWVSTSGEFDNFESLLNFLKLIW